MRLRLVLTLLASVAGALAGCAHPAPVAEALPPNPYGYLKPASICVTPRIHIPAAGRLPVTMTLNNDGGYCKLDVVQAGGGEFASFLVTRVPAHGSPLLYNYDGQSRITYTPTGGYFGPDSMVVELVPGPGRPRVSLAIAINVSNAPVSGARS